MSRFEFHETCFKYIRFFSMAALLYIGHRKDTLGGMKRMLVLFATRFRAVALFPNGL